ncbi:hypothetical protein [Streptomyces sp. YGL11-2]|uniref:hypothetical protein n=1 Tax=Streptomyces sp. YGL11-2 TaxID=3414028 RepID=UPI003CF69482
MTDPDQYARVMTCEDAAYRPIVPDGGADDCRAPTTGEGAGAAMEAVAGEP